LKEAAFFTWRACSWYVGDVLFISSLQSVGGCKFFNNSAWLGGSDIYLVKGAEYHVHLTTNACSESRGIRLLVNITVFSYLLPACENHTGVFVAIDGSFFLLFRCCNLELFFLSFFFVS
jgi:hypothetical protein